MSRNAYFLIAVVLGFVGYVWWKAKWLLYWGNAVGKDSTGASFYDASFIVALVVWGGIFVGILWGMWWCLKRAFRPPRKNVGHLPPEAAQTQKAPDLATPDEKLAHLVKKP